MADYCIGLDLGKSSDFSALVVVEVDEVHDDESGRWLRRHGVRHLRRWPLHTPYPQVVAEVTALLRQSPLRDAALVVDQTGVGAAVVDLFRAAAIAELTPVLITSGNAVSRVSVTSCPASVVGIGRQTFLHGLEPRFHIRRAD